MTNTGWVDGWRSPRRDGRGYTWYSTFGNGFRLDDAFLPPSLAPRLLSSVCRHETRPSGISDHLARIVELAAWGVDPTLEPVAG